MDAIVTQNLEAFNTAERVIHRFLQRRGKYKGIYFAVPQLVNTSSGEILIPVGVYGAECEALGFEVQAISPDNQDYFEDTTL